MKDQKAKSFPSDPMFNDPPSPVPFKKDFKTLCIVVVVFSIVMTALYVLGALK